MKARFALVFGGAASDSRNYASGLVQGGVAGESNVIKGVLECKLPESEHYSI